jgi:hypothetical protein
MKTSIKYVDTTTRAGLNLANRLIWQGYKVGACYKYSVQLYKIYSK